MILPRVVVSELSVVVFVDEGDDAQDLLVRISDGHAEDRTGTVRTFNIGVEPEKNVGQIKVDIKKSSIFFLQLSMMMGWKIGNFLL